MSSALDKTPCRTPNAAGVTNIPTWKFECLRTAILAAAHGDGIAFKDLKEAVRPKLNADELERLGSLTWHTTVVKLELEVAGEITRIPGQSPQWIRTC